MALTKINSFGQIRDREVLSDFCFGGGGEAVFEKELKTKLMITHSGNSLGM